LNWNRIWRPACANNLCTDPRPAGLRSLIRRALLPGCTVLMLGLLLASCQRQTPEEPSLGVAYAGPALLNLRKDLSSRSAPMTAVPHGEELQILETRRRFVRVRTASGVEGWTDANLLLSAKQIEDLKRLAAHAAALPSEGSATVAEPLNAHTEPARLSPSFFQIPENGSVEVVGHAVTPRQTPSASAMVLPRPAPAPKKTKTKGAKAAPLISAPAPAGPPANWVEMSRPRLKDLPGYVAPPPVLAPTDDWSLVRTHDGKAGWVLSRMLFMSVPDEIAQYAEGQRVTAYLTLGDVKDGDRIKHNWLWTTAAPANKCCEFDSFRVFVWSTKRHHYETAFVERNISGFYPVELAQAPGSQESGFSLVVQDKDGKLYKRTYAFAGFHVRLVSREPVQPAAEARDEPKVSTVPVAPAPVKQSGWEKMTARVKQLWSRGKDR
jgi:hypothetical protein